MEKEQWQKVEEKVEEAEKSKRKSRKASRELYAETGILKAGRTEGEKTELEKKRVVKKALEREEFFERESEEILGLEDSPERSLVALQKENLILALKEARKIELEREGLLEEESEILSTVAGQPSGSELDALEEVRVNLVEVDKKLQELLGSSPEAFYGLHLKELKEYKKDLETGRIVETPYVKRQIEDIVAHFKAGKPVMIYGHLGTGKSELAMHVARNYLNKEALVISGSKHTTLAELYGHQVLKVDESTGSTVSDYFLGPIYRAMAEGKPIIIDEVNSIPHEVLISLNHILTRKVGDTVNVQQNSGTTVETEEGFGIMETGNLNQGQEKYIDRQDMDPAFLSRHYKIEYDYLPQKTEGSLESEAGDENELFHLMLARVMDRNGDAEVPKDSIKRLWNLAKASRVTQDVFAGREISNAYYFQEAAGRSARYTLKESVLSIRAIEQVIDQWQKEGYKREFDYYLWREFVSQSTIASDRAYLYQLLKDRFGFFQGPGWEQNPNYGSGGIISSFDIKPPQNPSPEREFLGAREIVEFAYGYAPERAKWPEVKEPEEVVEAVVEIDLERLQRAEGFLNVFNKELRGLEDEVEEFCLLFDQFPQSTSTTVRKRKKLFGVI